jgi:foldase protein PrsA
MTRRYSRILAPGAFFVVIAVLVAACGSGVPGDSVADVDGNPITTQAFNHWMYVAAKSQAAQSPGSPVIVANDPPQFPKCIAQVRKQVPSLARTSTKQVRSDCKQLFTSLSSQVMDFLIKAYWYQAEAAKEGVKVTDKQVRSAFTKAKNQQFSTSAQFQTFLSQTGQTLPDILFRFRINQIFQKLISKHTTKITPAAVSAYYNSHKSQFGTPQTRDIRIVLAKTQGGANAAKAALSSGQSWKAVAKKYSTDPTSKNNGGLLVGVTKGEEDAALDAAAFSAPTNKLLGPVKGQFGYYVFEVTKITQSTQQTLAQATPLIQQTLNGQQQTNSQTAVDKVAKKHWLRQTKCRSFYVIADCSGYKPPKTTTTPSTPTPSTTPPPTTSTPSTTPTTKTTK